jgi:DNA-binding cell septation regulator SpoVG
MTYKSPPASISDVKIRIVENSSGGLVAWVSIIVAGIVKLDNIAIRRSLEGSLFLTYPNKLRANGSKHSYFNPVSTAASKIVERAVFDRLSALAQLTSSTNNTSNSDS